MKKHIILYVIIGVLLLSCIQNKYSRDDLMQNTSSYNFELVGTGKNLSFKVDDETKYQFSALFTYTDESGKEYLTFLNSFFQLLFYDLNKQDFLFKIQLEREGPNGIPGPDGFYIENLNNIYITCSMTPFLYKVDSTGTIIQKIRYGHTRSGLEIIPQRSWSYYYTPLVFIDYKLYLSQHPWQNNPITTTPLCVVVDTVNQEQYELSCPFPRLVDTKESVSGVVSYFSRIFNGNEFVYSFFYDENIYVATIDHKEIRKYPINSKYIHNLKIENISFNEMYEYAKYNYGAQCYGNLIHDPFRNIYYRFAYPKIELENGPDYVSLTGLGRKKFSIIILDKDFNIIGETLFPEWAYCPTVMFVHQDGLYICNNHPMHPAFNEDVLSFECFEVVKK